MAFVVKEFRAADLLRVLADACNIGSPWNMQLAREEIRLFPHTWIVDDIGGEYMLLKGPRMREDLGRNRFLFFTHGVIIEFTNKIYSPETSIQKLEKQLEPYRAVIQEHFAAAAAVHFKGNREPFRPVFVADGIEFIHDL